MARTPASPPDAEAITFDRSRAICRGGRTIGRIVDTGRYAAEDRWEVRFHKGSGAPGVHSRHARLRDAKAAAVPAAKALPAPVRALRMPAPVSAAAIRAQLRSGNEVVRLAAERREYPVDPRVAEAKVRRAARKPADS